LLETQGIARELMALIRVKHAADPDHWRLPPDADREAAIPGVPNSARIGGVLPGLFVNAATERPFPQVW